MKSHLDHRSKDCYPSLKQKRELRDINDRVMEDRYIRETVKLEKENIFAHEELDKVEALLEHEEDKTASEVKREI